MLFLVPLHNFQIISLMHNNNFIPIVDLFAGPGGLGEGFTSIESRKPFKILISAEMESSAHQTLTLRAFYRILKNKGGNALKSYYLFCNGDSDLPYDNSTLAEWEEAKSEARQLELGSIPGNKELHSVIKSNSLDKKRTWVLIGGPPCQAYSLVGRSRNIGNLEYKAENDPRHFLYKEYLKIIQEYKPSVFVMENVKGILSSKINGEKIFHSILTDLSNPDSALNKKSSGHKYKIHSLVTPAFFEFGMNPEQFNANDFIIKAENYGIPQARHRVILLGIRDDIKTLPSQLDKEMCFPKINDVISGLPALRSKLSKENDSFESWASIVTNYLEELVTETKDRADLSELSGVLKNINFTEVLKFGGLRVDLDQTFYKNTKGKLQKLNKWYEDKKLNVWLNHETRGHMNSDLKRYLYASTFAAAYNRSPKGHEEFDLTGLRPAHANWETGKFSDRFRVQVGNKAGTTVTSHISKDGHYFIHPDPNQCRSLTVREAARIQTFPDNYFFQGNRTQQFHQVGNAVPPYLSMKIAEIVSKILN